MNRRKARTNRHHPNPEAVDRGQTDNKETVKIGTIISD
jgi:hypothetical protein